MAGFVPMPGARPGSLHLRLALLVAGTVLPVVLLAGFIVFTGYVRAREEAGQRVLQTAQSAIAAVDRELQNQITALQVLSLEPELVEGQFEEFRDDAERFIQVRKGYVIGISDPQGNQVFNTQVRENLKPWTNRDALHEVLRTKRPAVSDMYLGGVTSSVTFTVNVPVMRDGEIAYVVGYSPPREHYLEILRRLSLPKDWVVSLYDRETHHVARLPQLPDSGLRQAGPVAKAAFAEGNNRIVTLTSIEGAPTLAAFSRSDESGWTVAIGMPVETLDRSSRDSLLLTIAIGATLLLVGLIFASHLATQLVRAEGHRTLLMNELNHRVKNTLSAVQGIVARGLPELPQNGAYRRAAESRLLALSSAHNILSSQNWESASLHDLAKAVIEPYGTRERVRFDGPEVILAPRLAIPLAMVLNELATNAVKYGALSAGAGHLYLTWSLIAPDRLRLEWRETGGPAAEPPASIGYGTRFIERAVSGELRGSYASTYLSEGFTCSIEIPL
jgi:two-component sensor histidine kinase